MSHPGGRGLSKYIIITLHHHHGSPWPSSATHLCLSMWRGPQEYVVYEFIPTSPVVSHMSGSSNLVFKMGDRCPYSCCFVGCCLQDSFNMVVIVQRVSYLTYYQTPKIDFTWLKGFQFTMTKSVSYFMLIRKKLQIK